MSVRERTALYPCKLSLSMKITPYENYPLPLTRDHKGTKAAGKDVQWSSSSCGFFEFSLRLCARSSSTCVVREISGMLRNTSQH